ncbi:MAG: DUF58 domain-containing protein [Fusobacteriota bacterium]
MIEIQKKIKYKKYKLKYFFVKWFNSKVTPYGKGALVSLFLAFIFGIYVSKTLIYQIFIILGLFIIIAFFFVIYFRPKLKLKRQLPKYCSVGKKMYYNIEIKNTGNKVEKGLYLKEVIPPPFPTFEEFKYICSKKHWFSIKLYYRIWKRFIEKNQKINIKIQKIPEIHPGEKKDIEVSFLPLKRGHIYFRGINIIKRDPFSLFQTDRFLKVTDNIICLPKIYNLNIPLISSERKYNQGGIISASKVGNSEEFLSLRDYYPGDPVKNIHWKSYSKTQKPVVKEFNDEFFSRYGLVLDTFLKTGSPVLEEAISLGASIIGGLELEDSLIDLIFICQKRYIFTSGRGLTNQDKMLEILASVEHCGKSKVTDLEKLVESELDLLSSLIIILVDMDKTRKSLINKLIINEIDIKIILICTNKKKTKEYLNKLEVTFKVTLIEIGELESKCKKGEKIDIF